MIVGLLGHDAVPPEFRTAWFIESIATQTLITFAIRTRRVPFFRSRPSLALTAAPAEHRRGYPHRIARRASRFSTRVLERSS